MMRALHHATSCNIIISLVLEDHLDAWGTPLGTQATKVPTWVPQAGDLTEAGTYSQGASP